MTFIDTFLKNNSTLLMIHYTGAKKQNDDLKVFIKVEFGRCAKMAMTRPRKALFIKR